MLNLDQWGRRHGVSPEAMRELIGLFYHDALEAGALDIGDDGNPRELRREGNVQNRVRLEAGRKGNILWRNNVGATPTESGGWVRYGLANDSEKINEVVKSSDLIGIHPVLITPDLVGTVLGQFMAREVKAEGWEFKESDKRAVAQLRFIKLVRAYGGDAKFTTGEGSF